MRGVKAPVEPGTWPTHLGVEEIAAELQRRGYRVSADLLLDVGADGCWAHHVAQRACAVRKDLSRGDEDALVAAAIRTRSTA